MAVKFIYEQLEAETQSLINIFQLLSDLLLSRIVEMNNGDKAERFHEFGFWSTKLKPCT